MVASRTKKIIDGHAGPTGRWRTRGLAATTVLFGGALVGHAVFSPATAKRSATASDGAVARHGVVFEVLDVANTVAMRDRTVAAPCVASEIARFPRRSTWRRPTIVDSPADAFILDVVRNLTRVVEGVDRGMIAARIDAALSTALAAGPSRSESPVDDDLARLVAKTGHRAQMATAVASAGAFSVATRISDAVDAVDVPRVAIRGLSRMASSARASGNVQAKAESRGAVEIDVKSIDAGDAIRRQIKSSLGGVKACYERALKRNGRLAGRYVIRFSIGDGGRVEDEGLDEDTVRDVEMAACVRAQVRRWRFALKDAAEAPIVAYGVSFAPDPAADWSPR